MLEKIKSVTSEKVRNFQARIDSANDVACVRGEIDKFKIELDLVLSQLDNNEPPIQMGNNMDDTGM